MADDANLALDRQLCFAIYSAAHAFNRTYKPLLDPYGLTYPQYLVLLSLWQDDGKTVKALGEALHLDSGTLSPLLKRLEASGYIARTRDRVDERQVLITLTPKGRKMKDEAHGILMQIGRAAGCAADDLHQLGASLQALADRLRGQQTPDTV
ncbi:DNA-binding MarR family transcriptional regulator [Rhizobium subbaraonis]|uniref:DNA-binding MarR family transcriptional regulator n=2 Tax=Rhizobium subbaraonis TaxID=908946 RepID=A0A285U0M5_9HYPH|nr:DNA-binding MarR family transcriptional regulator [Rhizobium subbaraonis]